MSDIWTDLRRERSAIERGSIALRLAQRCPWRSLRRGLRDISAATKQNYVHEPEQVTG